MTMQVRTILAQLIKLHGGDAPFNDGEDDNLIHAAWAAEAMQTYIDRCKTDEEDMATLFTDLLANMFHLGQYLNTVGLYSDFPMWRQSVLLCAMNHFDAENIDSGSQDHDHPAAAKALFEYIKLRNNDEQHVAVSCRLLITELSLMNGLLEGVPEQNALLSLINETLK